MDDEDEDDEEASEVGDAEDMESVGQGHLLKCHNDVIACVVACAGVGDVR